MKRETELVHGSALSGASPVKTQAVDRLRAVSLSGPNAGSVDARV
jgi:hypothetical protein